METVKALKSPQATIVLSAVAVQKHALESLLSPNSSLATKCKWPRFIWGEGDERESSLRSLFAVWFVTTPGSACGDDLALAKLAKPEAQQERAGFCSPDTIYQHFQAFICLLLQPSCCCVRVSLKH